MTLEPLFDDVQIRTYHGRFDVQLEIPSDSTLTERDIDMIGALASWDQDPNGNIGGYEGGRSILVNREMSIARNGVSLPALQISGTGYIDIDFSTALPTGSPDDTFNPPSIDNFISLMPGTLMSTSHYSAGRMNTTRPEYRALGTYTQPELAEKVENTMRASKFELENLVTPSVETYGRYLGSELKDSDGQFGFMVSPTPRIGLERAAEEIMRGFREIANRGAALAEVTLGIYGLASLHVVHLVTGLRELHDKERVAHLQAHLSNFYSLGEKCYLVDWATMRDMSTEESAGYDNIMNRVVDLRKPQIGTEMICKALFGQFGESFLNSLNTSIGEIALTGYSGDLTRDITYMDLITRYSNRFGAHSTDEDFFGEWMKDEGLEGFSKVNYAVSGQQLPFLQQPPSPEQQVMVVPRQSRKQPSTTPIKNKNPRIGRNDPCPCDSGRKYKKCCGGH